MLNRRLKSGHSNNRPDLSVYTTSTQFVDSIYSNGRKKIQGNRVKSMKAKPKVNAKPMTAQQQKRMTNLNEQGSNAAIKDSFVSTVKQTIADEEAKGDNNSFNSDNKPVLKAALPAVDHEQSKRKIDDLMFRPGEESNQENTRNVYLEGVESHDMNGPETNLNEMPDLTTFDNRNSAKFNNLVNNKLKGKQKETLPNKSMRNLNKTEDEVLPIYKRRAYNNGPIKSSNQNYMQRPMKTNYSMKNRNAWVKDNSNMSGDENTNLNNQKQPIKTKGSGSGRQPSDFRINKNNTKLRGKTSNGARNPVKSTLVSSKVNENQIKNGGPINNRNTMVRANKTQGSWKRAQSQNNERTKVGNSLAKENSNNMFEEIEKFKNDIKNGKTDESNTNDNLNISYFDKGKNSIQPTKESKDFLDTDMGFAKDMNSMIKLAESKIKATADAMLKAQEADMELEKKIRQLNDFSNKEITALQGEDQNIQNQLNSSLMTRQERIANIVNKIVDQDDDYQEDENEDDDDDCDNTVEANLIRNQNTLMAFASKPLEPISEQVTEEIQGIYTEENNIHTFNNGPDSKYDVEKIFDSSYKQTKTKKVPTEGLEDTPMFGKNSGSDSTTNLFSNFLCVNEVSTAKKQIPKENITEENKTIKLEEVKPTKLYYNTRKTPCSNKQNVEALRVISNTWILYYEARAASEK
jgi:hypothetical protein